MSVLNARVDPATAKKVAYACMAAPLVAFGLRMVTASFECVRGGPPICPAVGATTGRTPPFSSFVLRGMMDDLLPPRR